MIAANPATRRALTILAPWLALAAHLLVGDFFVDGSRHGEYSRAGGQRGQSTKRWPFSRTPPLRWVDAQES